MGIFRTLANLLEAAVAVTTAVLVSALPRRLQKTFSIIVGTAGFHLDRRDRKWAYRNLDIIFADKPPSKKEKERIVKRLFINIASGFFDFMKVGEVTLQNFHRFFHPVSFDVIAKILSQKKGILAVSAHFGNWEYFGSIAAKYTNNVTAIIQAQFNPFTDFLITKVREKRGGIRCVYRDRPSIINEIGRELRRNRILILLADQRQYRNPILVPFFGRPAETSNGVAILHLWYGSPIVFAFSEIQPDGKLVLKLDGPYSFTPSGNSRKDCERIMSFIHGKFEEMISRHPEQWFSLLTPRWELSRETLKAHPWLGVEQNEERCST